MRFNTETC